MIRYVLFLAGLLMISCFNPHGEFVSPVSSDVNAPPVKINLNVAPDTIAMFSPIDFEYEIKGVDVSRQYFIDAQIKLTETTATPIEITGFKGHFTVYPLTPRGYYTLTIKVTQSSGTGSIADKLGLEVIVFSKKVVLHCDVDYPGTVNITSIERQNGRLKISWPAYSRINFDAYLLRRTYYDLNAFTTVQTTYTFTDQKQTSFYDSTYVGGSVTYQMALRTKSTSSDETTATFMDEGPKITKFDILPGGKTKVYWTKSKYPLNVKRMLVYDIDAKVLKTTSDLNDTTLVVDTGFGCYEPIQLKYESEKGGYLSPTNYIWSDLPLVPYEKMIYAPSQNRYYTRSFNFVYAHDLTSNQKTATANFTTFSHDAFQMAVSRSGQTLWVYNDLFFHKIDPGTLTTLQKFDVEPILQGAYRAISSLAAFDNGKIIFRNYNTLIVYDVGSQTVLSRLPLTDFQSIVEYSADGQYVIVTGNEHELYKLTSPALTFMGRYASATFDATDPNLLIVLSHSDKKMKIMDLANQTVLQQYDYPGSYYQIDPVTHWILDSETKMKLLDVVTNQEKLNVNKSYASGYIQLYNGTIYTGMGAHLKFN